MAIAFFGSQDLEGKWGEKKPLAKRTVQDIGRTETFFYFKEFHMCLNQKIGLPCLMVYLLVSQLSALQMHWPMPLPDTDGIKQEASAPSKNTRPFLPLQSSESGSHQKCSNFKYVSLTKAFLRV